MESIKEIYKIGTGPSSSHTMGPRKAAESFLSRTQNAERYRVTLYGSLAATGKGHMTDTAISAALMPALVEIVWKPDVVLPFHPNGMLFEAINEAGDVFESWTVFSVGGGTLREENQKDVIDMRYPLASLNDILLYCENYGYALWEYVEMYEGKEIWNHLRKVYRVMMASVEKGLQSEGVIQGGLGISKKAWLFKRKSQIWGPHLQRFGSLASYALAVSEENATGGEIVTAPTCGSCGVVPAVLKYLSENVELGEESIIRALATAGLIGNLIKHNASISGAEVGCQGEVGAACSMAAAAGAQLLGGTNRQIEYAAEMGMEHNLGLTCDPVGGLVQIPCIERNVFGACKALNCADFSLFSDGLHRVSFDKVVKVMGQTGRDLPNLYRETSIGGLAVVF